MNGRTKIFDIADQWTLPIHENDDHREKVKAVNSALEVLFESLKTDIECEVSKNVESVVDMLFDEVRCRFVIGDNNELQLRLTIGQNYEFEQNFPISEVFDDVPSQLEEWVRTERQDA